MTGGLADSDSTYSAVTAGGNVSGNGFIMYIVPNANNPFSPTAFKDVTLVNSLTNATLVYGPPPGESVCSDTYDACADYVSVNLIILEVPGSFYPDKGTAYSIQVRENEISFSSNTFNYPVNPNLAPPASLILAPGSVNVPYTQTFFSGGTAPVNATLAEGSGPLPYGLQMNSDDDSIEDSDSNGPTQAGNFQFTPYLTDAWGNTASFTELIQVFDVPTFVKALPTPPSIAAGTNGVNITLTGANYAPPVTGVSTTLPGTVVYFVIPGSDSPIVITPQTITTTQLTFTVPGSALQKAGLASVQLEQPSGLFSARLPFSILAPTITSPTSSSQVLRGSTFTVTGANFVNNPGVSASQIVLNGTAVTTTFVNSGTLTTTAVPAVGSNTVTVMNPGGAVSSTVTFQAYTTLQITTTSLPAGTVQTAYSTTLAGTGGITPYTWSATGLPAGLSLNTQTGAITGTPTTAGPATVSVTLHDSINSTATTQLSLQINPPALRITTTSLPTGTQQSAYTTTLAASGGYPPYTWSASGLPGGLSLNTQTGVISGTPIATGNATVSITLHDSVSTTATAQLPLQINAPALQITTTFLPAANQQSAYSTTLAASGGYPPYTWSASGLPAGLSLNTQTGVISGTPTAIGNATVSITVTDSTTATASTQLRLNVTAPVLRITTASLPGGTQQSPYSVTLSASGGYPPYSWSASGLPSGLTLNAQTGVISGTPTAIGNSNVTVTVTDTSEGGTATARFQINIVAPPVPLSISTSPALPDATQFVAYSTTVSASGGSGGYTFTLTGSTPPGLTFTSSGTLSGTPTTAGSYNFTVTAKDSAGNLTSQGFSLNIKPAKLTITTTGPLPPVVAGSAMSTQFAATGGVPPYIWSAIGNPAGTSFSANGALTGSATQPGSYNIAVTVKDSTGATAAQTFALTVTPAALTISGSFANGTAGMAYSSSVSATGGVAPLTWSASGVPAGLTFSNGSLTGTPSAAGTFTVSVTVTDSASPAAQASQSFTITISNAALTVTAALGNGAVNNPYSATLTATGGTPPYTFSVSGLPPGVSATSNTALSGTPTTAGTYSVSVTVTDSAKQTASKTITVTIAPAPLTVSTASIPAGTAGAAYSASFSATGGVPPYTWSASGLPSGLSMSSSGSLSGTVSAPTTANITVTVKDSAGTTASQSYSLTIGLPTTPPVTLTGLPPTANPGSQSTLQIGLGSTYPVPVTVNLTLTFTPDSGGDDPTVQFASGGRTAQLTIPAGSTVTLNGIGVQSGTVAGTVTITAQLVAGAQDITPKPAPTVTIRINAAAPTISTVTATLSGGTITVTVTGFSTTRSMTQAVFNFSAASGVNLSGNPITVQVGSVFSTWYASAASAPFGSQFVFTQPFTVAGSGSITSVTVTLTNTSGTSNAVTATIQ